MRRLLRLTVVVLAAGLLPAVQANAGRVRENRAQLRRLDRSLLQEVNAIRLAHGLEPLRLNRPLARAATAHATQMLTDGYFGHSSADGQPFWQRIELYYRPAGDSYWSVGENLVYLIGAADSERVVSLWMQSPEHRANILDPDWQQIGVAAAYDGDAPGVFADRPITVVATDFGVQRRRAVLAAQKTRPAG